SETIADASEFHQGEDRWDLVRSNGSGKGQFDETDHRLLLVVFATVLATSVVVDLSGHDTGAGQDGGGLVVSDDIVGAGAGAVTVTSEVEDATCLDFGHDDTTASHASDGDGVSGTSTADGSDESARSCASREVDVCGIEASDCLAEYS